MKCVLKCGFIKVCVQLGVVALQKMHKMGQKPFVSAGLMDICLVKEGRLSHIDEKGLSSCSIEILIPQKTRIKITAIATTVETVVMHEKKFTLLAKMRQSRMEIVSWLWQKKMMYSKSGLAGCWRKNLHRRNFLLKLHRIHSYFAELTLIHWGRWTEGIRCRWSSK